MYDTPGTGRVGFEVQFNLIVDPAAARYERSGKKLLHEFEIDMPEVPGWRWVTDPVPGSWYQPNDEPLPDEVVPYVLTDHREKYADSAGVQTTYLWAHEPRIVLQLELTSEPREVWTSGRFSRDMGVAYRDGLAELLRRKVVRRYPGSTGQVTVVPQVNIELYRDDWGTEESAWDRLSWVTIGLYLIFALRGRFSIDEHTDRLLHHLDELFTVSAQASKRFDPVSNVRLVLDGHFFGRYLDPRLDPDWVRRIIATPGGMVLLSTCFNNTRSVFHVKGMPTLAFEELAAFGVDDFARLRTLGVDSILLDVLGEAPQPHLKPDLEEIMRVDALGSPFWAFLDGDEISNFVRAALLDEDLPHPATVDWPINNPKKTWSPGCMFVELRSVVGIVKEGFDRYPRQFWPVKPWPDEEAMEVRYVKYLLPFSRDMQQILGIALITGRGFVRDLERGFPAFDDADFDAVARVYTPMIERLFHNYRDPRLT